MRVAVLILASYAPRALFATAAYFAPSDVDIFVHLDAKTDLAGYLAQTEPYPPRVKFLDARRRVYWGGFSMVEATLDLLRSASSAGPYDRYVFISDNSLPVRALDGFFAVLAAHEDMIVCKAPTPEQQAYYEDFFLNDEDLFDYRRGGFHAAPVDSATQERIERFLALKKRGKTPVATLRSHASWVLAPDSARLALDAAEDERWMESCRFAFGADEFFFPTLIGPAKYPGGLGVTPTYCDTLRFAPRTLRSARDLPFDMQAHFLFIRKIAPDFTPDLPTTCLALYEGVRALIAQDAAVRRERILAVSQDGVTHMHLFAPAEDDPDWGLAEYRWGRRFRRLKGETAVWRLRAPTSWRDLRLTLTCVVGESDAPPPGAAFEIDGRHAALAPCDTGYTAQFNGLTRPFDTIALHLPSAWPDLALATLPQA